MAIKFRRMNEVAPPHSNRDDDGSPSKSMEDLRKRQYSNFDRYGETYLMAHDSYFRPILNSTTEMDHIEKAIRQHLTEPTDEINQQATQDTGQQPPQS